MIHPNALKQRHGIPFSSDSAAASDSADSAASNGARRVVPHLSDIEPRTLLLGLLALLAIAAVSALAGNLLARAAIGYVEQASAVQDARVRAASQSTSQGSWQKGVVPRLYQCDPQWAERPYGSSTIGAEGAAPTCLAMVHIALTGDEAMGPAEVASYSQNNGFACENDATALLTEGATGLGLCATPVEADELALRREINRGHPIICATAPGTFDEATSYLVLSGIDADGRLVIRDPLSSEHTKETWAFEDILDASTGLWSYTLAQ